MFLPDGILETFVSNLFSHIDGYWNYPDTKVDRFNSSLSFFPDSYNNTKKMFWSVDETIRVPVFPYDILLLPSLLICSRGSVITAK